jgi:E3 ubiquitin-protein ligase synoviolin
MRLMQRVFGLTPSPRLLSYILFSIAFGLGSLVNAWQSHRHFYATGVYISRSGAAMLALVNCGLIAAFGLGKSVQTLVFGPLRAVELEHLYERAWLTVTELLLSMAIFRDEFDAKFAFYLALLLLLKGLHWITADRVDFMEHATPTAAPNPVANPPTDPPGADGVPPQAPARPTAGGLGVMNRAPFRSHFILHIFFACLFAADLGVLRASSQSVQAEGPSVMLLFGFEALILATSLLVIATKYALHVYDARVMQRSWERKSSVLFHVDLVHDLFKLLAYLAFFAVLMAHYGLPLHLIRDLYLTMRSFLLKMRDVWRYRQATRNMESRYPTASSTELQRLHDRTCIICREDMYGPDEQPPPDPLAPPVPNPPPNVPATARASQVPKTLPCGHVFHFGCLRSWLERQQTCPTCRQPLLDNSARRGQPARQGPAVNPANPVNENPLNAPVPANRDVTPFAQNGPNLPNGVQPVPTSNPLSNVTAGDGIAGSSASLPQPPVIPGALPQGFSSPRRDLAQLLAQLPPPPPPPAPPAIPEALLKALRNRPSSSQPPFTTTLSREDLEQHARVIASVQANLGSALAEITQLLSSLPEDSKSAPQSPSDSNPMP